MNSLSLLFYLINFIGNLQFLAIALLVLFCIILVMMFIIFQRMMDGLRLGMRIIQKILLMIVKCLRQPSSLTVHQ